MSENFRVKRDLVNFVHGRGVENTKYVDILDTTCVKNHRFDSLSCNILSEFFNVICKNFVSEINSSTHTSKKRRKKDDKPNNPKNNLK